MVDNRFKELRDRAGLSQAALSESIGIAQTSLGNYERGERIPDAEILIKFSDYFKVSTDYLLGRTDDKSLDEAITKIESTELKTSVLSSFCGLKDVLKNCIEEHISKETSEYRPIAPEHKIAVLIAVIDKLNRLFSMDLDVSGTTQEKMMGLIISIQDIDREISDIIRKLRNDIEIDYMLG